MSHINTQLKSPHAIELEFIRLKKVIELRARSKTSTYNDIEDGLLTRPVSIGARAVAWPRHEIEYLNAARLAGKSDDEIRKIVDALHLARRGAA